MTVLEVATYEGEWIVLRDAQLVTSGHANEQAAKQQARRCVNVVPGGRLKWHPGAYSGHKHEPGVCVKFHALVSQEAR